MNATAILQAQELAYSYAPSAPNIFSGLSADFIPAQFTGLLGANGAGKSTLLRLLAGLRQPNSGQVLLKGKPLSNYSIKQRAQNIAFVPQNINCDLAFTCREIVAMGRFHARSWHRWQASSSEAALVERCLRDTHTEHLADRLITQISGGEAQRIFIAQALAQEAQILILDEPTSHLDIKHQVEIMELVSSLCAKRSLCAIAALHDLNLAAQYCQRLLILSEQRLLCDASPSEALTPDTIKNVFGVKAYVASDAEGRMQIAIRRADHRN